MHKLRAFKNTSVFQKHGKIHFESWPNSPVSHGVVWISYSRLFFLFVNWTRVVWATRVSGQWYRSMIVMVFLVPERRSSFADVVLEVERALLPWMLLTSFVFRNGQSWVTVLLFSSFPWFWACHQHDEWIGSRSLGTSGFVVSPCNLQVFRQHSMLYLCTSGVPTTRRQYGAELFTLGALFLAHMAMAGSASLNVEMILRVIPPLKWHDWLDRNGR